MKSLIGSIFSDSFNKAGDVEALKLTHELTQAFYRREHDTIAMLAQQGARFTEEMLLIAVGFKDAKLVQRCLHAGVQPTERMVMKAVDKRFTPMLEMLIDKTMITQQVKSYIAAHGTDEMKKLASARQI